MEGGYYVYVCDNTAICLNQSHYETAFLSLHSLFQDRFTKPYSIYPTFSLTLYHPK